MRHPVFGALAAVALGALTTACASAGATPTPFPFPMPAAAERTRPGAPDALLATALELRGVPYRNGGNDRSGFDCSGFTQWVFAQHGIALPREVRDQFRAGEKVNLDAQVLPGDLVFFDTAGSGVSHVAMMLAGDQFVHAPSSTGVVRVERLSSSYWSTRYAGARRIVRR